MHGGRGGRAGQLNAWLRTTGAFHGVLDFDRALRDPAAPTRMLAADGSGDHLHPGDAGYAALAGAVDLRLPRGPDVRAA
ncbi:hypothetical protein [Streptomyces griseoruber]|uniref:SGNH hydrolase-type esterase domain-containing protein n=1 Tax=Streptomyces griseoruber TaxID=1943 RepID=A0A101TA62_9ACTN|nr:hypothetical protein AQJ64_02525 [Streptomyces griseoruber]